MSAEKQYFWLFLWAIFVAVLTATLPLLPVDETRYLTVAWEMRLNNEWLLMTLNGEPYSHKPPMLFWLINLFWSVLGENEYTPRFLAGCITAFFIFTVSLLEKEIYKDKQAVTPWLLLACPLVAVYGTLIMFDCLLACFVILSALFIYKASETGKFLKYFTLFGLVAGLGIITKGPVGLLHIACITLLAPLWSESARARKASWYGCLLFGLLVSAAVALAWAIPAALSGGKSFAHELFVTQTAGRMGKSFDHLQPVWWYLPLLPAFVLPLLFTRNFWQGFKIMDWKTNKTARLLLVWLVPTFLAFSLIGGKQAHYLIPLLPALLLLLRPSLAETNKSFGVFVLYVALGLLLLALPYIAGSIENKNRVIESIMAFSPSISLIFIGATVVLFAAFRAKKIPALMFIALLNIALCGTLYLQLAKTYFPYYDLRPLASELQQYKDKTIGYARNYQGEFGFMARLEKPLQTMDINAYTKWLQKNKSAIMVVRVKDDELPSIEKNKSLKVLYKLPYRTDEDYVILRRR